MNEIFLPILEMRNSSVRQKAVLLNVFSRLCLDPQALVEIYINYDCDRTSLDNVYERLVNIISRIGITQYTTTTPAYTGKEGKDGKDLDSSAASTASWTAAMPYLPAIPSSSSSSTSLSSSSGPSSSVHTDLIIPSIAPSLITSSMSIETQLKRQSLECLVSVLRSLVAWAGRPINSVPNGSLSQSASLSNANFVEPSSVSVPVGTAGRSSDDEGERSFEAAGNTNGIAADGSVESFDDPGRFETAKMRKTTLLEGIRKFNFKPKRGIHFLTETGFIRSRQPKDIAAFLLHADGLNKAMIGEYLGEG